VSGGQKLSNENDSQQPRDLKNRHSDSLRKSQLPLSQGMLKKGDDDDDEVNDDVRITVPSQNNTEQH
jgi:hypothetical protein